MDNMPEISFEELNAFIDGELDVGAAARVLAALDADEALKRQSCELRALRDVVRHAYEIKRLGAKSRGTSASGKWRHGIAAGLVALGILAGWLGHAKYQDDEQLIWERMAQIEPHGDARRLVLHVGDSNLVRFENTIEEARDMLEAAKGQGQRIEVEILANGPGLDMLRVTTTPVAAKLERLQVEFPDLALVACGQGLLRLQAQGADTRLLPGVATTDSALNEIVRRMDKGWAYLRV